MIISPSLALSALTLPTLSPNTLPTLCYDARYAIHRPEINDCWAIIARRIVTPQFNTQPLNFSRQPQGDEFRVPYTWAYDHGGCVVVADIPDTPYRPIAKEESSLADVKRAALQVLGQCVALKPHLGGMAQTGKRWNLQVRVEAREPRIKEVG